jgi:alcohol/geraniol dehydrogenase (NADP+)
MPMIRAWAAPAAAAPLEPFEYDPGPLGGDEVEIAVEHCGVCHSDVSLVDNEWGRTRYPFVPGHEAVGRVVALGDAVPGLVPGQRVGLGWNARSCLHCNQCVAGDPHLCARVQPTLGGRHGAFAERVRAQWLWVVPLPEALDGAESGPLMCGGITVFSPLREFGIAPTARVGVVGIGGLGHLALKFCRAWGCEVTAFTTSPDKEAEARAFGAHHVVSTHDPEALRALAGRFDLVLDTVNAPLDWAAYVATLAPRGRLHIVGAVLEPMQVSSGQLMRGLKSLSASPTGSRSAIDAMLAFAARHRLQPQTEHFPMARVNEALDRLRAGKARYRIVLDADFA